MLRPNLSHAYSLSLGGKLAKTLMVLTSLGTLALGGCQIPEIPEIPEIPGGGDSDGTDDPKGSDDPSKDPADEISLVVQKPLELCTNSQNTLSLPEAFQLNARMEIPAQIHHVGPLKRWESGPDGLVEEPPPPGPAINFRAQVHFERLNPPQVQKFEGGVFTPIADHDLVNEQETKGWGWLYPDEPIQGAGKAVMSKAKMIAEYAQPIAPKQRQWPFELPMTSDQAHRWRVSVGCTALDPGSTCRIGDKVYKHGLRSRFGPCIYPQDFKQTWIIDTERGELSFDFFAIQVRPPNVGLGLFSSASGSFDGTSFTQPDPMMLAMVVEPVASGGIGSSFGVLFEAPRGDTCGLIVENLDFDPQEDFDPFGRIGYEIRCDMTRGKPFRVSGYEILDPED